MRQQRKPEYVFVTGCAGFIGFHLCKRLLDENVYVLGLDNLNEYYDPELKNARLAMLKNNTKFHFIKGSIENLELLENLFEQYRFKLVVHLAAQAGVRYSLENPHSYIQSNLVGFTNILECCKNWKVKHLLYASSSSVYGANKNIPFSTSDCVEQPISIYAATKKANELMAYTYSHLYKLPSTGLRFFTVYGPWGRPDMALFTFCHSIMSKQPIKIYNYGNMKRDFTYIDDVVEAVIRLMEKGPPANPLVPPHKIYNIGCNQPVQLNDFIRIIEEQLGRKAKKIHLPLQPGDMVETYADIEELTRDISYRPRVELKEGVRRFVRWFREYYKI